MIDAGKPPDSGGSVARAQMSTHGAGEKAMNKAMKKTREAARDSLPPERHADYDALVAATESWSRYFYGTTLISYAIIAELVRDGWTRKAG